MRHSSHLYLVSTAQGADIDSITTLLQDNSPSQGGSLTGEFSRDKVASMADGASPVIVARRAADGPVVGVLFSAAPAAAQAPVVLAMLAAYAGSGNAYVYGPVCIADSERGQGLLALLYFAMREQHGAPRRCCSSDATIQARCAHERLGMREVAAFDFDGAQFAVYSDAIVRE